MITRDYLEKVDIKQGLSAVKFGCYLHGNSRVQR